MGRKIDAYADSSAFIAFMDRSDTHHSLFQRLFSEPPNLITTALVVSESHAWFLKRYDRYRALRFLAFVDELKPLEIVPVGASELMEGSRLLQRFSDQSLTLVDALGLHVMHSRRIKQCWSTDFHLGLMGGQLVIND